MKKILATLTILMTLPLTGFAAGGYSIELEKANNSLEDKDSLQRGAILFSEYCMACHSLKYMRYNRIARDLGWEDEEAVAYMTYNQNKPVDSVMTRMLPGVDKEVLGTNVPDLSLMARLKGTDYIYSFLRGYEIDEKTGEWDNKLLHGTSMPNVLEGMQRHMSAEEYDQATRDIANFLEYVGEPAKLQRHDLGWKVLLFLLVLIVITYLLKKEYWRDVKH
ncbi:Cytochrome c1 [Hydrogenovibrio crunogenus]|uniref:Cytochrome c1 n=1 Tax=Hydrogenovibrio crunogenus TaxID=39765 RepID=A0A4P7NZA2_9GAMM|nr:cytochrome c1 [Hydrogenovibrio crunogenus]QBZ83016.1 Cytochrome c1 [Hydrogenovibrio crunogenus]RUM91338.1 MAG: cytochrome c1 [Thiomicrospira sp.]